MNNYTEQAKQIYNKVCDKYKHHWLDTTISQTMAMEMITEALNIVNVVGQSEQLVCCENCAHFNKEEKTCEESCINWSAHKKAN